jgi:hypothetical protein
VTVAIDGTKIKANASRHKAMSYERMQQAEAELKAQIDALLEVMANVLCGYYSFSYVLL